MSLILADARALPIASGTAQCCVTSPPYWGLRDYGVAGQLGVEQTPDAYVAAMVAVFRQVRRVLRDDGTLWLNLGDSYQNAKGQARGVDPKQPARRHGLRPQDVSVEGLKPKDLVGVPWLVALALRADGWFLRADVIWSKPNPMCESVTDRPTRAHEYVFLLTKSRSYFYDAVAIQEEGAVPKGTRAAKGSNVRSKLKDVNGRQPQYWEYTGVRNARSVWTITTQPYGGAHFATMPERLAERCILAGSRPGDLILDPFVGSGTVARCAISLGRRAVGCDLNREYLRLADERTQVTRGLPLEVA
jgi:DNA modification methylase